MLITPTLLDSFKFFKEYEGNNQDEKRAEFLALLAKEKFEPNEAMRAGILFEDSVVGHVGGELSEDPLVSEAASYCSEAIGWQTRLTRDMLFAMPNDLPFLDKNGMFNATLYGKADAMLPDRIIDIKKTSKYEAGKFHDKIQHHIYLVCAEMEDFRYVVADKKAVYTEDYQYTNERSLQEIGERIENFLFFLANDPECRSLYKENWS